MIVRDMREILSELKSSNNWDVGDLHKLNHNWRTHFKFSVLDSRLFQPSNRNKPIFLVRPQRLPNQCTQDYLMMIAEANHLRSIIEVCRIINIHFNIAMLLSEDRLEQLLRGELAPKAEVFFKKIESHPDLLARICSICLHHGSGISEIKNYAYSFTCEIHNVMLIDACPACRTTLRYDRRRRNFCDCDYDLGTYQAAPIESWIEQFYKYFAPWRVNAAEPEFNMIVQRSDAISCHMARLLMRYTNCSGRISSREYKHAARLVREIFNERFYGKLYFGSVFSFCHKQIPLAFVPINLLAANDYARGLVLNRVNKRTRKFLDRIK